MIKNAKLTFLIGFIVLSAAIGLAEYQFIFKEWVAKKDSLIDTVQKQTEAYKGQIESLQKQIARFQIQVDELKKRSVGEADQPLADPTAKKSGSTGDVNVSGDGSIGNSGNGATINAKHAKSEK